MKYFAEYLGMKYKSPEFSYSFSNTHSFLIN